MSQLQDSHMRQSDAFSWYMERDPLLRSTVVVVLVFDRAPDPARLLRRLERASRTVPGLRHRLVEPPMRLAPPRWVADPSFDLTWHVRRVEAPPPRGLTGVFDLARKEGMSAFDPARPLWSWTTVEGLRDGRAAAILKLHHSLTDGIGGMELAAEIFDLAADAPEPDGDPDVPTSGTPGRIGLILDALGYDVRRASDLGRAQLSAAPAAAVRALRHPAASAAAAVRTMRSIMRTVAPITETRSPVMRDRRLGWHYAALDLPLDDLKRAARVADGTLNDVFLAGIVGGLERYHACHDTEVPDLWVTMPISIRKGDDPTGGNRITLMRFLVPVGNADVLSRVRVLHDRAASSRAEPSIPLTNAIAGLLNLLPTGLIGSMLKHVDFLASNVPGLAAPIFVAGARVDGLYPFGPTIGAALNVTLLSYCGTCNIGVNTDTGAVPDPDVLTLCLRDGFQEALALAGADEPVRIAG
jgi:WS/DGAT/MGAT family acyltransferase